MLDLWYKNAVLYCLDVETFQDSNGDGVGDFAGLTSRLDHLERLGVNCLWLNPFYPTPNRDNGYDITDFYGVDPRHGSLGDFVAFSHAARDHGLRIIIDLVVNHTSIDHPWFRSACESKDSPYRDWYVWKEEEPRNKSEGIIFPGQQDAVWSFEPTAGAWYLHRFYRHQADLNVAHPAVREEIQRIMGFWLALGVSGFRVDAVPFLIEYKGLSDIPDGREDPYELLGEMHDFMDWRRAEAIMLAEANVAYDTAPEFFGNEDRMQLVFDFIGNQALWLGFARGEATPIKAALEERYTPDSQGQWAVFLRNHDELSLDKLTDDEREEVYRVFGPEPKMQIYDRGLRRRLAPMLDGDADRMALAFSLMFALPGTPVIWYGDEIGLGENLELEARDAVRCPMQWTNERGAGFSTADPACFVRALATGAAYAPDALTAAAQRRDPHSLLNRVRALVTHRRAAREIGRGCHRVLAADDSVLALICTWCEVSTLTVHNFAAEPREWVACGIEGTFYTHLASGDTQSQGGAEEHTADRLEAGDVVKLPPFGYRWLRSAP